MAIKAYREGKLPFPDGTMLAALHSNMSRRTENDKVFGEPQSFVAGPPTNVQFMVKDSKKMPRRAAGDSVTSRTVHLPPRYSSETLRPLPREGDSSRLGVYSVRTLMPGNKTLMTLACLATSCFVDRSPQ